MTAKSAIASSDLGPAGRRFYERAGRIFVDAAALLPDEDDDSFEAKYVGWEVSRLAVGLSDDDRRALAGLAAACMASVLSGSTRLPTYGPGFASALEAVGCAQEQRRMTELLQRARSGDVADPVRRVIGSPGERTPLVLDGSFIATERMRALERRFCERVRARCEDSALDTAGTQGAANSSVHRRAVTAVVARGTPLTDEQIRAVREGMRARIALITGGPGTGKTTTVVALVRALVWSGLSTESLALCAPTGKAAQRLADALGEALAPSPRDIEEASLRNRPPQALTLHRLLGWSPSAGRFARHENDPLSQRVVIVDEASMIDLAMMDRLIRALRPDARLVLVGDADQLPSVEAGAVFRDLCAALKPARLRENLRVARDPSARAIVSSAQAINGGFLGAAAVTRGRVAELAFQGVEHLDVPFSAVGEELLDVLDARMQRESASRDLHAGFDATAKTAAMQAPELALRTYRMIDGTIGHDDASELATLFACYARSRILCATRVQGAPACAVAVNSSLVDRFARRAPRPSGLRRTDLALGAPVVVLRNDYARNLFNGDQGVVVLVDPGDGEGARPMAVFARAKGFVPFPLDAATDMAPAFALTVHKAQGSEYEHVVLVLPEEDSTLLTRELVYTAVTRARRSVLVVGRREVLVRAIARTVQRHSGVADALGSLSRTK